MEKKFDNCMPERRSGSDRRTERLGDLRWLLKTGRRRLVRRKADHHRLHMLDYYSPKLFCALVFVLLLSVVDALLTLWLIDHGAVEINPVMAFYIELGPLIFMVAKYVITVSVVILGVLLNYSYVRFFRIKFGHILNISAVCFSTVVAWELFLIYQLIA